MCCEVDSPSIRRSVVTLAVLLNLLCGSSVRAQETPAVPDGLAVLAAMEQMTVAAVAKAERSVVAIARVRKQLPGARNVVPLDPLSPELGPDSPDAVPTHFGSGVVLSADGFIVTCAHVLDDPLQNAYYVWLDKRMYEAKVVSKPAKVLASDPFTDLAVLKIEADSLTPITMAKPEELKKGQFVIALGNPYAIARDGQASASWGIISNLNRLAPADVPDANALTGKESLHQFGTLIHTDAKLNLGTSGGALINMRGEMVGLTTALAAVSGYEQAAGYAIAVDALFLRVIESLKAGKLPEFGFLGIRPEDLGPVDLIAGRRGAKVSVVVPGLPGEEAGLRPSDIIAQVNSRPISNRNDLFRELSQLAAGAEVELLVERGYLGQSATEMLVLKTSLSKKYISTTRPSYALHGPQKWRGMLVEYATAVPSEFTRTGVMTGRRSPAKLAVLAVDPGTPAWDAGMRPGYGILAVDAQAVETPEAFERAVQGRSDRVVLQCTRNSARPELLSIAPDAQPK